MDVVGEVDFCYATSSSCSGELSISFLLDFCYFLS